MDCAKVWCAQWCDTIVPVECMGSNRSNNVSSTTDFLRYSLLSKDIEQFSCLLANSIPLITDWCSMMQRYLSCMDILILSQQQMKISHLLPPFQGIALMLTWTAWTHATRPWSTRWMAGAVLPQTLWTLLALKFHCVDPTLMFVFRQKTHEFFVFFHNMYNRFNSLFTVCWFI